MLNRPENIKVLARETVLFEARANAIGRKVPRSPREPAISETQCRRNVETLCLVMDRSRDWRFIRVFVRDDTMKLISQSDDALGDI